MAPSLIQESESGSTRKVEGELVTFQLGNRTFGLPVGHVSGFVEPHSVTPIPLSPSCVLGVFDVSGKAVTLIDLRQRLGLPDDNHCKQLHCLVLDAVGDGSAILVDAVRSIGTVDERTDGKPLNEPDMELSQFCTAAIRTVDETVLVLDTEKVLNIESYSSANDVTKPVQPILRLVASDTIAKQVSHDEALGTENLSLLCDLGGHKGIMQVADDIAFKILDDDTLNQFLGSLDAVRFPNLVAQHLIDFVTGQATRSTRDLEAILTRLVVQQGFDQSHFQRVLAHAENALMASSCSAETRKSMRRRLVGCWENLAP